MIRSFIILVVKRNGSTVPFQIEKIVTAIEKAMHSPAGHYVPKQADAIAKSLQIRYESDESTRNLITIKQIESDVFDELITRGNSETAKAYEGYRSIQEYKRLTNTTDDSIISLIKKTNTDLINENSNKNAFLISTQRDLIAGEVSKDIARRKLIPEDILEAHDSGAIHIHDLDYYIQPMFNCCLVNLEDMLENGTVINGKLIESPKSFQVACTVTTQIMAQVASCQFGGQSINRFDSILAPYVRKSYNKYFAAAIKEQQDIYKIKPDIKKAQDIAWERTKKEVKDGIQTVQYQINTLNSSNGQSPFVTLFLHFDPNSKYAKEAALIQEEILKQRIQGIKNDAGVYVTPAFPKLIYALDKHNAHKRSPYYYLTELAAKSTAKRMYPDYISVKKMKENYDNNAFSPMGCRSFLSPWKDKNGNYKFDGRFNIGVVSLNLPQIAIIANGDESLFWNLFNKRIELIKKALLVRYNLLKGTTSDVSPIHWQYGAIARLKPGEKIDSYLNDGYATLSMGYIGLYEVCKLMTGESNTTKKGKAFAMKIMDALNNAIDSWKKETHLGFALYGTPAESLTHRFNSIDKKRFGVIKDITDKGYYTNSYHVDVREPIDVFSKFEFEAEFQKKSKGGCISYVEIPNMTNNIEAVLTMIEFIYDHIQYAEFNTKSDYCHECGFDGEITLNDNLEWECPRCGNNDKSRITVVRRTCGLTA